MWTVLKRKWDFSISAERGFLGNPREYLSLCVSALSWKCGRKSKTNAFTLRRRNDLKIQISLIRGHKFFQIDGWSGQQTYKIKESVKHLSLAPACQLKLDPALWDPGGRSVFLPFSRKFGQFSGTARLRGFSVGTVFSVPAEPDLACDPHIKPTCQN